MQKTITRLYPLPGEQCALEGAYLQHRLHTRGRTGHPFVYSNFITSLDGRIAIASSDRDTHTVPSAMGNPRDWRLYQELAGQADLLITSGRFYRQSMLGEAQDILPLDTSHQFADIHEWRSKQELPAQPDIAIISASLDIPLETLEPYRSRKILVITGRQITTKSSLCRKMASTSSLPAIANGLMATLCCPSLLHVDTEVFTPLQVRLFFIPC